jgi:molecular chaperone DnaK
MDLILGIDFGTTNTVVCFFEDNKSVLLNDGIYKCIPSKIGIKNDKIYYGNYIPLIVDKTIHSFKTDIDADTIEIIHNNSLLKRDILILFLEHIKKLLFKKFENTVINFKTVITVPSNFNDTQREIIKHCFNKCNFNVLRIINEPSAAALSYGLGNINELEEQILVLDLGGGTMDITLLLKENGFFEIKHSIGINDLGGNNFTDCIYNNILKEYPDIHESKKNILWHNCQSAKEKIYSFDNINIKVKNYNLNDDLIFNLTISKFEKLCNNLVNRIDKLLEEIKNNFKDIKYIIMVGNTSKIILLQTIVKQIFNINPWIHPNLESVVAHGACLYGAITENVYKTDNNVVLVDVVPLSLGVEIQDGSFSIIIPKNTPLPVKRTQRYTTDTPYDNSVKIKIYQGERKLAEKNTFIKEILFDKISTGGTPVIDITFKVDLNGIINITILDKKSNIDKNILIKDIPTFNQEYIDELLKIAETNNDIDTEEMLKKNRLYQINIKIELIINNIKINNLINDNKKKELIDSLILLDNQTENANSTILLNILKKIDEEFLTYSNENENENNDDINLNNNIESIDKIILKEELELKINLLLNKNPEWSEYLDPIIDELKLSNITIDYIKDKLEIINELDNNLDYKEQYKNLCLFIKSEIEKGNISLDENNIKKLDEAINNSLSLLDSNDNEIDWENEIIILNNFCDYLV